MAKFDHSLSKITLYTEMPLISFNLPRCYLLWLTVCTCSFSFRSLRRLTVLKSNLSLGQIIHKGTDVHTPLLLIDCCQLVKSLSPIVMLCVLKFYQSFFIYKIMLLMTPLILLITLFILYVFFFHFKKYSLYFINFT